MGIMSFSLSAVPDGRSLASRLLPGSRIIVRFAGDTTWWHERLICYPVSGLLFVILTGGDDLYVEDAGDWTRAIDVTGKETYPLGLKGGLVHFDIALDDDEVLKRVVEGRGCAI